MTLSREVEEHLVSIRGLLERNHKANGIFGYHTGEVTVNGILEARYKDHSFDTITNITHSFISAERIKMGNAPTYLPQTLRVMKMADILRNLGVGLIPIDFENAAASNRYQSGVEFRLSLQTSAMFNDLKTFSYLAVYKAIIGLRTDEGLSEACNEVVTAINSVYTDSSDVDIIFFILYLASYFAADPMTNKVSTKSMSKYLLDMMNTGNILFDYYVTKLYKALKDINVSFDKCFIYDLHQTKGKEFVPSPNILSVDYISSREVVGRTSLIKSFVNRFRNHDNISNQYFDVLMDWKKNKYIGSGNIEDELDIIETLRAIDRAKTIKYASDEDNVTISFIIFMFGTIIKRNENLNMRLSPFNLLNLMTNYTQDIDKHIYDFYTTNTGRGWYNSLPVWKIMMLGMLYLANERSIRFTIDPNNIKESIISEIMFYFNLWNDSPRGTSRRNKIQDFSSS